MIKRYFIVVLLLFLFPAGVSAQRRPAAKKDWKAKYDYVGAAHDGRILVHRGGEGSDPRMGRFYTDGCFGYTDTCGTVVIPLIYDYADSFSNGFAVVGKGEKNDRRFGLIDRQGREVVPCIYADVAGFSSGLVRVQEGDGFRPPLWVCRYAGTGRNSIEIRLCPGFFRRNGSRSQRRMER